MISPQSKELEQDCVACGEPIPFNDGMERVKCPHCEEAYLVETREVSAGGKRYSLTSLVNTANLDLANKFMRRINGIGTYDNRD